MDKNVENAQHDKTSLSSRLCRRNNCCFPNEKHLKLTLKKAKNLKVSIFQCFYAISVQISTDSLDWNVENVHQCKKVLSSSLLQRDICSFLNEKCFKLTPKITKKPKTFNFQSFYAIFDRLRGLECLGG